MPPPDVTPVPATDPAKLAPKATTATGDLAARIKPKQLSEKRAGKPLRKAPKWAVSVTVNQAELDALLRRRQSPTGRLLLSQARRALAAIRPLAPVSTKGSHGRKPGYLRSNIVAYLGEDTSGLYADVVTRARAKGSTRSYYGRIQNQRGRYLQRGLKSVGG